MTELKSLIKDPTAAELELVALYGALPEDTRRERAFKAFAWNGLPHRRMEAFKWTDFRRALPELKDGPGASEDPFAGIEGPWIVFRNGRADGLNDLPEGLRAFRKDEAQAFAAAEDLPLGALTAALVDETILIEVTEQIEKPLRLIFASSGDAEFARIAFVVRRDASLTVMESHLGGAGLNGALLSYGLQAGAKINRTLVQPGGDAAYAVTAEVFLDQDAEFTQTALAFGGHVARVETRLVHQETGSRAEINGAYLAAKGRHIDFTSHIRHGARACETVQRTKGAVLDGGTGVFQGKFHVPKNVGQKTSADMQHNALLLEDGAVVNAKPELEIYADDVECAHGNTCGALDPEQLFYLRQRGIPDAAAKALLTEAFVSEALDAAPDAAKERLLDMARFWLNASAA